jgi:hypothetical protein
VLQEVLKRLTKLTLKNGYKVMHANWVSGTWTVSILSCTKQKGEGEGGEAESGQGKSSEHVSHSMALKQHYS